jgi:hypothetical protein
MPTQEEINDGQKKINGKLCQVDWRLLAAIREVRDVLNRHAGIAEAELLMLDQAIQAADVLGAQVAKVDPPGCEPIDPSSPGH